MSARVIYSFRARRGKADELLAMLQQGRDFGAGVEGSESFDVYQGSDDAHRFVMVERWASVEAHQSHFEQNVKGSGMLDAAEALMTAPLQIEDSYYLLR